MSGEARTLAARFAERLNRSGRVRGGEDLVVALSGGVDSVALLHLLRFTPGLPPFTLVAAHVDHAMREGSGRDAAWVAGLCRAWGVTVEIRRLDHVPASEAQARAARYAVLEEIRMLRGAELVLTAHHADDQVETVLFRVLRGTGIRGLRGIPEGRAPALWRPLLPFDREEIVAYARLVGLGWREDPTNTGSFARNVLRHQVLPLVERSVAAGARRALRGLARRARDDESAWRSLEPEILARADVRREPDGYSIDRAACVGLHPALRARVIRGLVRRLGGTLHDAGTRLAVEFTTSGASGGKLSLGGGIWLRRDLGRLGVVRGETPPPECVVTVPGPGKGRGRALLAGRGYDVTWSLDGEASSSRAERPLSDAQSFEAARVTFPLTVRSWRPGDRIRLAYGSKKLKKLLLEARIPVGDRPGVPVLVDASGAVLWVHGVARSVDGMPTEGTAHININITDAESD